MPEVHERPRPEQWYFLFLTIFIWIGVWGSVDALIRYFGLGIGVELVFFLLLAVVSLYLLSIHEHGMLYMF